MSTVRSFISRIRSRGTLRAGTVVTKALGRERTFVAYDLGRDTYVFEKGVTRFLHEQPSVLVVAKSALRARARGFVFTMTSGNHAVAALPLLDGRFWRLSALSSDKRSETFSHRILCANVVRDRLELSQRDLSTETLVAADAWLIAGAGFAMSDVTMADRNMTTLEHYRRRGLEWRVKPLAWTEMEMRTALAASRTRRASRISYYHSARGVQFLSYSEFARFSEFAKSAPAEFLAGLKELVGVYEGDVCSLVRQVKYRGHHEIEFFGLRRGVALEQLVPQIERLMEDAVLGRLGHLGVIQKADEILALYRSLLTKPEFADEESSAFVETLYMYITGEIYSVVGEGSTPAFDDRRTALPGASFVNGRPLMHPGADSRTAILLANLCGLMSKDERIEYANVYELRANDSSAPLGRGSTREIVYKTSHRPLENSMVEKRLSRSSRGYGSYFLSRVGVLRALGVGLSEYYLMLRQRPGKERRTSDYYIRRRCEGEPMEAIPASYFRSLDDSAAEDADVVLALAGLMGDAAAQNLTMKKYDPATESPLYGVGKEIYEFEYDIVRERVIPKRVTTCSIRGSFGWPSLDYTDANLGQIGNFYFGHYARALLAYHRRHSHVPLGDLAARFMSGFEFRTHALAWQLSVMRDKFEAFEPDVPAAFAFVRKWRFVMWALERHERRLPVLKQFFSRKLEDIRK